MTKYQLIINVYESTLQRVTNTPAAWTAFMRSACRNYKCRFDEQILIYAQHPNAKAVLEIEKWNRQFGRWVNKGATGIAVFDDDHNGKTRLKHYFDIADTHESRHARPVPLWQMEPQYEADVIEHLENSFGELEDISTFAAALISAAKNAVDDNITDYLNKLAYCRADSFLEELDDLNVEVEYRTALRNSVAYMLLTRCGIDAESYFDFTDFQYIIDFNTLQTANALGMAVSDIAESCLREISATVISLQKQERNTNRTVANQRQSVDNNIAATSRERSIEYGTDIPRGGRLQDTEPDRAGRAVRNPWQIRITSKKTPQTEQQDIVREPADNVRIERTPNGDRENRQRTDGTLDRSDGSGTGHKRITESVRSDEMDRIDEQHPTSSGGNNSERSDICIKPLPTRQQQMNLLGEAEGLNPFAFSVSQQIIDEILTSGGNKDNSICRIISYFKKDHGIADNAVFLQKEYGSGGKGFIFNKNHVSVWFDDNGIRAAAGNTAISAPDAVIITWEQTARRIRELLDLGRYAPQSELDKADGLVLSELTSTLYFIYRDGVGELPQEWTVNGTMFHDCVPIIAEHLLDPEKLQAVINKLDGDWQTAQSGAFPDNFKWINYLHWHVPNALRGLEDLQSESLVFTANESVTSARPGFITQDEVDSIITGSPQISDSKFRIYSFFVQGHTTKEKVDFLKDEYGWGGASRIGGMEMHDGKGISFSRENNHMPYDKVLLPWNKVANCIDELIADGRYMSQNEIEYIPEYEMKYLAHGVYSFYQYQPEEVLRPFPYGADDREAINTLRTQLDDPERVNKIHDSMASVLDNTADFDRNYKLMKKAFDDLTSYQNGTFSLFASIKPAKKETEQMIIPPLDLPEPPAAVLEENTMYDLRLGITVFIGTDDYEIYSFDDTHVVLRDMKFPLFTKDMPREEFDRKLRENRLNDHLIVSAGNNHPILTESETPRILYRKYLPLLLEEIRKGELYPFFRERDTNVFIAETEIGKELDLYADGFREKDPAFFEAYAFLPQFREWLIDDILERTYQDVRVGNKNNLTKHESREDCPDWAKRPDFVEQIREELYDLGSTVSMEVIASAIEDFSKGSAFGNPHNAEDIAHFIEENYLNKDKSIPESELKSKVYIPEPGDCYEIQGRQFIVDSVDTKTEKVSLRDVTFQNGTGFPIFRSETLAFINMYEPIQTVDNGQLTVDSYEKDSEGSENSQLSTDNSQPDLSLAWEQTKQRSSRTQTFDLHPEIPMSERQNYRITDDNLGVGGAKTKFRYNLEAIKTLQKIELENRFATPEEQEILARYVGWGGLPQAFDPDNRQWENEYIKLHALLSPEEYESARSTTLNAHYTSPVVIKAIYKAVENMGFKTGNVLEPSCGIGNFFGLVPESMNGSKMFGIELDSLTGRIAQQLYQKNNIAIQGFEKAELPDSFFDLAIGNVPFGSYGVVDKRYDRHKFHIHDYFFARTLDKVRPGGIIAFITSKGTLDKQNLSVRKYIAQRADLLGAIRLPMTAFKTNAGTEVTTDIIFLQKRDRIIDIEPDWIHLGQTEDGIPVNSYFVEHPDMMLGTMSNESGTRMYGNENSASCIPFPDSDLEEQLNEAISNVHAEITEFEYDGELEEDNSIPADPDVRNFSYTLVGKQIYYRQDSRMVPMERPVTTQNRIKGLIELRECVRNLIFYQTNDYPDNAIELEQAKLNRLYDNFTRKYGLINSRGNSMAFAQDSAYCLLCSLEVIDENGELERKADMFKKRTIKPHIPITRVDTASEALAVSLAEKAKVDIPFMAQLANMNEDAIIKELEGIIFLDLDGSGEPLQYVTADEYLSGNVRQKLEIAREFEALHPGEYTVQVKALEAALPKDLTAAEISVRLGATWVPPDVIQKFIYELLQTSWSAQERIKVNYIQITGEWSITEKTCDRSNIHSFNTYGTQRIGAYRIIEESLNLRDVRAWDKVYNPDGTEKRILNKRETAIAQAKQELIRSKFKEWIWQDPNRREQLCRIYNDRFNSVRPREYDGSHLKFPGMNPEIALRKHQVNAIAHGIYGGNMLAAHEVGAGKTFELVAIAMESKRLGLCNKSLIVVPNHITEQWAAEFLQLYPSANILVSTKKDFETKNRKKFCARIATGDYDAVIIGHSQFERIPMSLERQQAMFERQIDEIIEGIRQVKANRGEQYTIKAMERMKKNLEVKLNKLHDQSRKDNVVTFEELGVDKLFVDEVHCFKNLYLVTKMRNVGGIAQVEAQKSSDLFMKCRYLDEITGNRGTVFATGTPISNSMVELYTLQRYLQYDELVRHGLQHFDSWSSTFGETVAAIELAPDGTGYRAKTRFAKFYNLPELMSMFKMVADIQTADMLDLPAPKANFHTEVIRPSQWQRDIVAELAERAEAIRKGIINSTIDNMLKVTNDGRKLALDQRLINPLLPDDPDGKVAACANNVFRIWDETKDNRLTQLVFSDLSTPKGDGSFNVYDDLKTKLVAKGVPAEEIAFIHEADNEKKKKELFAKVRKGQIRVLVGSTQKMGAGTNVQKKLIALHDLDCPWRPSEVGHTLRTVFLFSLY